MADYLEDPEFMAALQQGTLDTARMRSLNGTNRRIRLNAMYAGWCLAKRFAAPLSLTPSQNSSKSVLVAPYYWEAITPQTPVGVKMQVINQSHGVATYGHACGIWTHYAPLPQWRPKDAVDKH